MLPENAKVFTVGEFNRLAQQILEQNFSGIWIEGEISNYRGASGSGHAYFCLKDASAQIDVVAFRGVMQTLRFKLEEGLHVLMYGRATLYPQRGRFQIVAESVEPRGAGALQLAFEQLKKKLQAEGLFDPARKKPIPALPQKIGIVTSPTGAALKDILTVIDRRFANVEILVYPVKVQGEGAKEEIVAGIRCLNERHPDLDVLLVGRGGGSIEDLWAFNEEVVARAIAASRIPVISCVGHEIDFTIADFVADLRAPTPSAAAEIVVKNKAELRSSLTSLLARLQQNMLGVVGFYSEKLKGISRAAAFARPEEHFEQQAQSLDDLQERMLSAQKALLDRSLNRTALAQSKLALLSPRSILEEKEQQLEVYADALSRIVRQTRQILAEQLRAAAGRLEALSPLAVLARGYAIAWALPENKILKSALQVSPGDAVRVKLHQGEVRAEVKESILEETKHEKSASRIANP